MITLKKRKKKKIITLMQDAQGKEKAAILCAGVPGSGDPASTTTARAQMYEELN